MTTTNSYDVVIVGLGPTGLTMAHLLGRRGMSVLVLEREPEFYGMARAVYTDDEALRVFQTAGVADAIHADMNVDSAVQWMREDGTVMVQFHTPDRPLWWPVVNFLYQPYLENKLESMLEQYPNVEVRRGREVLSFDQDRDGVAVTHAATTGTNYGKNAGTPDESTAETVRGAFLVGADGGRSVIRMGLGIDMTGKSFPERWLVVDLKAKDGKDAFRHLPYFDFLCTPEMPTVSCPQPGGHHRFEFALTDDDDKDHFESDETVRRLIGRYVDPDEVEVRRKLVYTFNAVVADRWREGRILLAGDAAHMTPQFIGQGMNAGVRDADNLSWKLQAILQQGADMSILDSYQNERHAHAKAMIDLSVFNKSLVSVKDPRLAKARDAGLWAALHTPGLAGYVKRAGMKPKPRLRRGYYLGLPRGLRGMEGTLFPQAEVRLYDGRPVRFDDAVGIDWVVMGIGIDPREKVDQALWSRLDTTYATLFRPGTRPQGTVGDGRARAGLIDIEDSTRALTRRLARAGVRDGDIVVLRPDKFVFATGSNPAEWEPELVRQLGLGPVAPQAAPAAAPAPGGVAS